MRGWKVLRSRLAALRSPIAQSWRALPMRLVFFWSAAIHQAIGYPLETASSSFPGFSCLRPDEKAARLLDSDGRDRLSAIVPVLESISPFDAATIEARLKSHVETTGMKLGQIAQPLRAALTGRAMSPGIFDVLEALGQSESLARIKDQAA